MVEELIDWQTAVLAKEKGFNINTDYFYPDLTWDSKNILHVLHDGGYGNTSDNDFIDSFGDVIPAPTQSLLQKWLREVHKIHIELNWFLDNTWEYWLVSDHLEDEEDDLTYNFYEEALEKGLFEALSTIK